MNSTSLFTRIKWFIALLLLIIIDTLPGSVLGFICMYILIFRPRWFKKGIDEIYDMKADIDTTSEN